ncbi:lasso peptide biosynthesis PqqD family chaperone [Streptomyces sp. NPDC026672]|uniref:lasso peptide biosynthesis PqqD family chaperone n=1 Tax=unclassified Streptomyces TaxID=2593676 RepID=UPI0033E2ED74
MTFALTSDVTLTDVEDGLVLLDQRDGRYWHLNGTGAAALRMLLDGSSPEDTARRLGEQGPEAAGRALSDVRSLVEALRRARLVVAR